MYTIIGGDGREYGPVTAEQVRAWIAGGRANQDTKVKLVGGDAWKRVADFPEFSADGSPGAFAPADAVPPASFATPEALVAGSGKTSVTSCYERSWTLLKANFLPMIGTTVLVYICSMVMGFIPILGIFLSVALNGVFAAGLFSYYLKRIRGQPATVGDAFAGFGPSFAALMIASILVTVLEAIGFVLLILPGIYLAVAYAFTFALAIDKNIGFWEAMETSRKVITKQWWTMLGLILLGALFALVGIAALLVGIFVAAPLVVGAMAYAYEDTINPKR